MPKIYTKTGDAGETGLWGGGRVPKDHGRVSAYGEIDELNSCIGIALNELSGQKAFSALRASLARVQEELFIVGALLAAPDGMIERLSAPFDAGLPSDAVARLEAEIDAWSEDLPKMDKFIMPGGSAAGAWLHFSRAVCRRAERSIVNLAAKSSVPEGLLPYVNRLSDHLFTAARWVNAKLKHAETPWQGLAKR